MLFAISIASCSVLNLITPANGPKVSSWQTNISEVTPVIMVGSKKVPSPARRLPPEINEAPLLKASLIWDWTLATASSFISGPCFEAGSSPFPTFNSVTAIFNAAIKASWIFSWTKIRLAQTQVWPLLRNLEAITPLTATSRSASSKTISGALPPNSSATFLTVFAQAAIKILPTSVDPVKLKALTIGLEVMASPTIFGSPTMTFNTPFGIPARDASSAIAFADSGVSVAGLIIIEQPAPSAGPALRAIIAMGKFQGVIDAVTPIGCLIVRRRREATLVGIVSP